MAENRNSYLNKLIQRAMGEKRSSVSSQQYGTPTKEEDQSRTRSVGTPVGSQQFEATPKEETQSHTRSVGTSVGQDGQTNSGQQTNQTSGQKPSGRKGSNTFLKGLISGTVISDSLILKDIKYSALIVILGIIFIANRFSAERVEREIAVLEQEVRDTRAEALSVSAELGSVSRQSEITDLVKERGLGLEELREPPYRIVVNE
jgi:hypothetical protein